MSSSQSTSGVEPINQTVYDGVCSKTYTNANLRAKSTDEWTRKPNLSRRYVLNWFAGVKPQGPHSPEVDNYRRADLSTPPFHSV